MKGTLSSEKVIANVTQMESSSDVAWPGRTLRAWDSPDDDLEKESHATGMASIPVCCPNHLSYIVHYNLFSM